MTPQKLIHRFNLMNGNALNLSTAKELHAQVQKALDHDSHGSASKALREVQSKLVKFMKVCTAKNMTGTDRVEFDTVQYHPGIGIRDIANLGKVKTPAPKKKRVDKVAKPVAENKRAVKATKPLHQQQPTVASNGVATLKKANKASAQSGVNYHYKTVDLGPYKKDFHRMFSDTIVQIHGSPGHGKTVYLLKMAQHRAAADNVLYVAREEYGRSVFDMKLKEHNIGHKNLRFRKTLEPEDLTWATVVVLDSATALKLTHEDIERLADEYPNRNWILVLQSTKNGGFRGSLEWEHLVDIAGEVRNRKLILRKNRLDPNNATKMDKLMTDDAITESKKKIEIRNAVKESVEEHEPENKKAA